jgi:GR25 family glycosyltransferase involved in LPS biosynthesis
MQQILAELSCQAVVISLKRSAARARQVQHIVRTCPIPCAVWEATDGAALPPETVWQNYRPELHEPAYPFALKPGEIGCYLSHRSIWQEMVDKKIDRLLVVEDDIEFLPNFKSCLQFAIDHAPDGSYVQFQVRDLRSLKDERKVADASLDRRRSGTSLWQRSTESLLRMAGHSQNSAAFQTLNVTAGTVRPAAMTASLVRPSVVPLRTSAQLVTLQAAQRLLNFSSSFDRPVDVAIQMTWLHGTDVYVALPRSVQEVSAEIGGSTIATGKRRQRGLIESVRRQWHRNRYRRAIAKLSQQHWIDCARNGSAQSAPIANVQTASHKPNPLQQTA